MAALLSERGDYASSIVCAQKAVAIAPRNLAAVKNLGSVLFRAGLFDECRPWLEKAASLAPRDPEVAFNLGAYFYTRGQLEHSEKFYTAAAALAGDDEAFRSHALVHMAFPVLAGGDYRRGLALYDHRFSEIARTRIWDLGIPEWRGQDLSGKTILIHHDQGIGDDIQFCRFLPELAKRGATVILAVPRELIWLMNRHLLVRRTIARVVDIEGDIPSADFHSPMMSYLQYIDTTMPPKSVALYFHNADEPWSRRVSGAKLNIGIVWSPGSNGGLVARRRIVPLELLLPLAELSGVALYSLQVGEASKDIERLGAGVLVEDLSPNLQDWADTADALAKLDGLISVDTGALHLAGAMGLPCIALLPFVPCWRWGFGTDRTPWYPTMWLLRQDVPHDWGGPLHQLRNTIVNWRNS